MAVQLGAVFPQTEIEADPGAVRAFAQATEGLGLRHLVLYDHVLSVDTAVRTDFVEVAHRDGATSAKPYDLDDPFHEVMVLMGFLAGVCELELSTGILILPQRQTALVAKQAAEVDILSGGRLRLGVGIGWNRIEAAAMGTDFDTRARRFEEQIALLRRYWTERSVRADGPDGAADGVGIVPTPVQRPIPIWLAGGRGRALERVGRLADGWLPVSVDPADVGPALEVVRAAAVAAGRDPDAIGVEGRLAGAGDDDPTGTVARFRSWQSVGASHVALNTMGSGLRGVDAHVGALTRAVAVVQGA